MKYPGKIYGSLNDYRNDEKKSFGICELFDTSKTGINEIMSIMENADDSIFDIFVESVIGTSDYQSFGQENYQETGHSLIWSYFFRHIEENFKENVSMYRLLLKCFCAYCILDQKASQGSGIVVEPLTEQIIKGSEENKNFYYRGQSNKSWGLVPSIFRSNNFMNKNTDGDYFDLQRMFDVYKISGLIDKANETIFEDGKITLSNIGYNFVSFMQHAVSFSPLIDVTNKMSIATFFALGNRSDFNGYNKYDSVLFEFYVEKPSTVEDIDAVLRSEDFSIRILKGKIKPGTMANIIDARGNNIRLDFTTTASIINQLRPKYKLVKVPTNDRMRYQHGSFIMFYDYLLVNDRIMFQLNKDIRVKQYTISTKDKNRIYDYIHDNYEKYVMDYMLNPYMLFGE